jgi:SAM-dependent methyltransferase
MLNRTFVLVFLTIMTAVVVESFHRSPNNKDKMSYEEYLQWQKKKSLDPVRRKKWKGEEWNSKFSKFKERFLLYKERKYFDNNSKVLLVGARTGQEVAAMRDIGVSSAMGMDIVEDLPYVIASDMHDMSFAENKSYDFIFSNIYDHALHPDKFASELHRVLKPGRAGRVCLHCMLNDEGDSYTATRVKTSADMIAVIEHAGLKYDAGEAIAMLGLSYEVCFINQ